MDSIRYNSLIELIRALPDETSCISYLEVLRWGDTVVSPHDPESKVYKTKRGYRCKNTGKDFNVLTGTVMQGTKAPIIKWIMAMWLLNSEKKGMSSHNLARKIGVCQNTAWYMLHRLREAYEQDTEEQLFGIVEVDETFVGGKNINRHWDKKVPLSRGRAYIDKTPVFGALQRGGRVYAQAVPDTKSRTIQPILRRCITSGSTVYSDEWSAYRGLNDKYDHNFIVHGAKQYANGDCCTNGIENFWSIFKRGIVGIYHRTSRKHLQKYVQEFVYRFNTREMSDSERFYDFLSRTDKRLTYKQLVTNG